MVAGKAEALSGGGGLNKASAGRPEFPGLGPPGAADPSRRQ